MFCFAARPWKAQSRWPARKSKLTDVRVRTDGSGCSPAVSVQLTANRLRREPLRSGDLRYSRPHVGARFLGKNIEAEHRCWIFLSPTTHVPFGAEIADLGKSREIQKH